MITEQNKTKMEQAKATLNTPVKENKPASDPSLQRPKPQVSVVQPVRANENEVIFRSLRPNFAFFMHSDRIQFKNGFLLTDDEETIKYVKDNFLGSFVAIVESGPFEQAKE